MPVWLEADVTVPKKTLLHRSTIKADITMLLIEAATLVELNDEDRSDDNFST
jgi:hypothetical protein